MKTFAAIILIIYFIFYSVSTVVSHYIYRVFKSLQAGENNGMMGSLMPFNGGGGVQS
jgi:hypothetical protein